VDGERLTRNQNNAGDRASWPHRTAHRLGLYPAVGDAPSGVHRPGLWDARLGRSRTPATGLPSARFVQIVVRRIAGSRTSSRKVPDIDKRGSQSSSFVLQFSGQLV